MEGGRRVHYRDEVYMFCHTLSFYTEAQVALSQSAYYVTEGGNVTVCAEVASTSVSCQINFPFSIKIFTEDGTAGIIYVDTLW